MFHDLKALAARPKLSLMTKHIFLITLFFCLGLPLPAAAQERVIPGSRLDVQFSYAPLVEKVAPAVVNIYTKRVVRQSYSPFMNDPFFEQFFGRSFGRSFNRGLSRERLESSLGSGVIVEPDGLIVTNAHVAGEAEEITVVLPDGREFRAEKALVDAPSDIALLRIDPKESDRPLPYAPLTPSESLKVGDLVLAIGNPFGVGQTVTSGIVSALARFNLDISDFNFFIQTDAAINPGNSGGPLVSMDGGVVGINTAIFSASGGSLGIGFAVPAEMVATVIAAEKAGAVSAQGVVRPWLGFDGQSVTQDIAQSLGLDNARGVLVGDIHPASPARKAGLKTGDVILVINDRDIRDPGELKFRLATLPLGETAALTVWRRGQTFPVRIEAMAPPDDPPRNETLLQGAHPLNGVKVARINPAVQIELGIDEEEGVVILGAHGRSGYAARIVQTGDVILSVNDREIEDIRDLERALERGGRGGWAFVFSRGGQVRQVVLR